MTSHFYDYRTRMLVWSLVIMLIASLVIGLIIDLERTRTALLQAKAIQTQHLVEAGHTVIEHYYALQKSGKISESIAKTSAINAIRSLRYGGSEYFWINDQSKPYPFMIMHPTLPELEGKRLDDESFNTATHIRYGNESSFQELDKPVNLFVAFHQATELSGHGFVRYQWPKPLHDGMASKQRYPKLSFAKKFTPWGWMIGSGIYIEDIDRAILEEAQKKGTYNLLIAALLLIISFFVTLGIGRIEKQQQQSRKRMQALIDATSESVFLLDAQGKILMINHFGAQRFQTTPDQLVGKNFYDMIPESTAQGRRLAVEDALLTGEPVTVIDERAGIQFENNIYPVRSLHDDPDCVAVYAKDITDRHRNRLIDEIFRHLDSLLLQWQIHPSNLAKVFCNDILPVFNLSAVWIGKIGANGQLQLIAHSESEDIQFLASLTTPDGQLVPLDSWPPIQPVLAQGYRQIMRRPTESKHPHELAAATNDIASALVLPLRFKHVTWGVVVLYHRQHRSLEENLRRLSTVATRLSRSLESASQQEWLSLLNTAVMNADIPLLFTDAQHNILWLNPALASLLGKNREELIGHNIKSILPDGLATHLQASAFKTSAHLLHQDGHLIPVSLNINTLKDEEDAPSHTIVQIKPV